MTLALVPYPRFRATDDNGFPLAGGFLYSYLATTSTPQALLTSDGSTSAANPVELDDQGEADIRLGPVPYKLVLTDSLGVELWTVDNVSNLGPTTLDDYSATVAQMRLATDPGEVGSEVQPTSLAEELRELRYATYDVKHALDPHVTYWYETPYGQNYVNVKSFGARGDNATDDTAAIAAAIASLPTSGNGGGVLFFPLGNYVITSALSLKNLRNIHLVGQSMARRSANDQSSTLSYTASSGSLFTLEGAVGIQFRGLNLRYTHASYASILVDLDQGTGSSNTTEIDFIDCRIGGSSTSSLTASSLVRAAELVYDIGFYRCVFGNAVIGVLGSESTYINSNSIKFRDCLFLTTFSDCQIKAGGQGWSIIGCTFEPATGTVAASVKVTAGTQVRGFTFHGNWCGDAASGYWVDFTNNVVSGASFQGNDFQGSGTCTAIKLGAAIGVTVLGNMFEMGGTGVELDTASAVVVLGNRKTNTMVTDLATVGARSLIDDATRVYLTTEGLDFDRIGTGQTSARLRARNATDGMVLEWGLANAAGYGSTIGYSTGTGRPHVAFNCWNGTTVNTFYTAGIVGRVLQADLAGGLIVGRAATASADNQSLTADLTISSVGQVTLGSGALIQKLVTLTYGPTITPDLRLGNVFVITITDNVNFTIANPSAGGTDGQAFRFVLLNTSGGAHGTISWGSQYKRAASASLTVASASNQTIEFTDAGGGSSVFYEAWRTAGDVPN